ncbi:MAG: hypothetical protein J0I20_20425 [Chloroflexi bacterium]|nr:hypothetical protein [Chloroflexota bacterium]
MKLRFFGRHAQIFAAITLLVCLLLPAGAAFAEPSFVNNQFQAKWQRADKPIQDGTSNPSRSWMWGPEGFNQTGATTEPYADSPGGTRQVQYFDKARMELNNPSTGLVTNGLLVIEMISGREATGDATNITRKPADIPVAGDAVNNDGPTYASLASIASLNLDKPSPNRTGQQAGDTLDKAGQTGTASAALAGKAKYVYFDSVLKHNIPDVFWNFMNQKGNVYQNGALVDNQPVLGLDPTIPWLDATGYPLTEAYWTRVTVGGVAKDVLLQAFQRRVLTYTPDNPAQYQVEMGNVGRHYFTWRYSASYDIPATTPTPTPTAPTTPTVTGCDQLPASTANTFYHCGPAGMQVIFVTMMASKETVTITGTGPNGAKAKDVTAQTNDGGELRVFIDTLPTYALGMWTYKAKGMTSGKEAVLNIWLDPPVTKPTIIFGPNPAKKTDEIHFLIVGFPPNAQARLTLRCPCGGIANSEIDYNFGDGGGLADSIQLTRDIQPPYYQLPGVWTYTVSARNDNRISVAVQFTIIE